MISYPPVILNEYLAEKVPQRVSGFQGDFNFFTTKPTDINSLDEQFPSMSNDVFAVYDRMFRLRRDPFPHVKKEQILYYLYKKNNDPEALIESVQAIQDLFDRGDESAQEVNAWASSKTNSQGILEFGSGRGKRQFKPIYFHEMKVFQLEEARDIEAFDSNRTFTASKIIINYDYHTKDYS
jgi:hypothetical protein